MRELGGDPREVNCLQYGRRRLFRYQVRKRRTTSGISDFRTLAVDGWVVTFGTAMRGLDGLQPRPVPS